MCMPPSASYAGGPSSLNNVVSALSIRAQGSNSLAL